MQYTIEQFEEKVIHSHVTDIFYSAQTGWWTDDLEDVDEATRIGKEIVKDKLERILNSEKVPAPTKDRIRALWKHIKNKTSPVDPIGRPLLRMEDPRQWLDEARRNIDKYGKHGIHAFMKAHHKNCKGYCFSSIEVYGDLIDGKI